VRRNAPQAVGALSREPSFPPPPTTGVIYIDKTGNTRSIEFRPKNVGNCEFIITYPTLEQVSLNKLLQKIIQNFKRAISDIKTSVKNKFVLKRVNLNSSLEIIFQSEFYWIKSDDKMEYGVLINKSGSTDINKINFIPQLTIGVSFKNIRKLINSLLSQINFTDKKQYSSAHTSYHIIETIIQLVYPYVDVEDIKKEETEIKRCILFVCLYSFLFNRQRKQRTHILFRFTLGSTIWMHTYFDSILQDLYENSKKISEYFKGFATSKSLDNFQVYLKEVKLKSNDEQIQAYQDMKQSNYFKLDSIEDIVKIEIRDFSLLVKPNSIQNYQRISIT